MSIQAIDNYIRELEASDLELREFSEGYTKLEARKKNKKSRKNKKNKKHGDKKQRPEVASGAEGAEAEAGEAPVQEGREYLEGRERHSSKTALFRKVVNGKNINKAADMLVTANKVANQFSPTSQEYGRRSDDEYIAVRDYLEARERNNRVKKSKSFNNRPNKNPKLSKGPSRSRGAGKLLGAGVGMFKKFQQHKSQHAMGPLPHSPEPDMVGRDEGAILDARDLLALNEELGRRED